MKKYFLFLLVVAGGSLLLAACKKDTPENADPRIFGFWTGMYNDGAATWARLFRADKSFRLYNIADTTVNGGIRTEGTYSVSGNTISFSYQGSNPAVQPAKAVLNAAFTRMEGVNEITGEAFYLEKP